MSTRRFSKASRRKNAVLFFILLCIVIGLTIFIFWFTLTFTNFYVKDVQIKGLQRLSHLEVLQETLIPPDISLLKLDIREISQKIKLKPTVKNVTITKELPSTLLIEIEERLPYVYVEKEEKFWEVDKEGVLLGEVEFLNDDFCLIAGIDPFKEKEVLVKALKTLNVSRDLNLGVRKIVMEKGNRGIVLNLEKDVQVVLGRSPNYDYLSYLPDIFRDVEKKGERFTVIDLRFDNQIVASQ